MRTKEEQMEIAKTIAQQIGGNMFKMMTGAEFMILNERNMDGLMIKFKGSRKANTLKILLNWTDTYDLEFGRVGKEYKVVEKMEGIYFDELQDVFERVTGLYTSLHRRT